MRSIILYVLLAAGAFAQSLAVVPLHSDPDQLFKAIRTGARIDAGDCKALEFLACIDERHASSPTDVSLRWVQLDEDPELEAILVAPQSQVSATRHALVFDHGSTWNLVGHFVSSRTSDQETMIRVQQLTNDSPKQVIFYRDLGGSGQVLMMTDIYALIGGRLRQSLELKSHEGVFATAEPYQETSEVRTGDRRIVIHTVWEKPMGSPHRHTCRVLAWDVRAMAFVAATKDTDTYCDAKTGRPKEEMTNGTGLFSAPPYVVLQ